MTTTKLRKNDVAPILNLLGSSVETSVLDYIREADGDLAQKIMDNMFTFDDLSKLDDKGFPQPTGEFETLAADSLVLALGQDVDLEVVGLVSKTETYSGQKQHRIRQSLLLANQAKPAFSGSNQLFALTFSFLAIWASSLSL